MVPSLYCFITYCQLLLGLRFCSILCFSDLLFLSQLVEDKTGRLILFISCFGKNLHYLFLACLLFQIYHFFAKNVSGLLNYNAQNIVFNHLFHLAV